jgi:hypothetical protein
MVILTERKKLRHKLWLCIAGNATVLTLVIALVVIFESGSTYWRIGWHDDLVLVSVKINTMIKYFVMMSIITLVNVTKVVVEEIGMPILGFNVYNPDKKVITEFGKFELQIYANSMFMISGLRGIFMILVNIAQIDIAVWSLLVSEGASLFTIRMLLNDKEFKEPTDDVDTNEEEGELLSVIVEDVKN